VVFFPKTPGSIADVYDGAVWKSLLRRSNGRPFIGLLCSTDGFGPFTSNYSSWPIMAAICNLPPSIRIKHLLLLGLVPGPKKPPSIHPFLEILVRELAVLENGISFPSSF